MRGGRLASAAMRLVAAIAVVWLGVALPAAAADPFDPVALMIRGQEALARGDVDGALAIYDRGLADRSIGERYKVSYHIGRSQAWAMRGRLDFALADADAAVALADRTEPAVARGNVHAIRGLLLAGMNRRTEAIKELEAADVLLQSPDDDYADLLNEMMKSRPDQVDAMRRRTAAMVRVVRDKLDELRGQGK